MFRCKLKSMIGLGQIPTLGNTSNRIFEMRLFQEVARVDEKEAEQGALHSDALRLSSRERDSNPTLSRKGITDRLSRLWLNLKTRPKERLHEEQQEDCPIATARAQSLTGANAPLGWLTLDNLFTGTSNGSPEGLDSRAEQPDSVPAQESTSLSFLQSDPEDSDYLFNEEWFLSPYS